MTTTRACQHVWAPENPGWRRCVKCRERKSTGALLEEWLEAQVGADGPPR